MSGQRFIVSERDPATGAASVYLVLDSRDRHRPVARFASRADAEAHAARLEAGPLDWDEQAAWQDPWRDDRGEEGGRS